MEFCKQFNARTQAQAKDELIIPVIITVYSDRSFTFITKTPPAAVLIKKARGPAHREEEGLGREEAGQGEGREDHPEAARGDRQAEDARPNTTNLEAAHAHHRWHRASMGIEVDG